MGANTPTVSKTAEVLPPPTERSSIVRWLHKNLFSTWYNALLTVVMLFLAVLIVRGVLEWAFTQARWEVITANLRLFMVGQYPVAAIWRIWACVALLALLITGIAGIVGYALSWRWCAALRRISIIGWILYFPVLFVLVSGVGADDSPFPPVPTNLWGGLLLTLLLSVVGIVFSFPLGVLLGLGRLSCLPVVRWLCVAYIELIRGVPFISVLFMAQLMLPLFLPGITIDRVVRAMAGVVIFSAAYLAENVRGGLQSIPRGQYEAARALGLNPWKMTLLIILPQALRAVIPILVGQFIALFKDTSLVVIVGLLDLMGIARTVLAQPDFLGLQAEVYTFVAFIYGIFCYLMSAFSQRLEAKLHTGR